MADELDAVLGLVVAFLAAVALTPLTRRVAHAVGAVDQPRERGLAERPTPRLGGLAILAGVLAGAVVAVPVEGPVRGILLGAGLICLVGAVDDVVDLAPTAKLAGQVVAALVLVLNGVRVENVTLPFAGPLDFGSLGGPLTLLGVVAVMNVVNFSDGVDGLAAGVCAISAAAFAVIAFDLGREPAGVLSAVVAGAALGFLVFNFHPASVFMGDAGSLTLGLLLGAIAVEGSVKTNAVIALVLPLVVLAVPFLDTGFVIAKRVKYGRPIHLPDREHFHHRFTNIGFSQRRTALYLYAWTLLLASLAVALRFVPYSDDRGNLDPLWAPVMAGLGLLALAASVYLVVVLEILKFKRLRTRQLRRLRPDTGEHEIEELVARELDTGEWEAVRPG